MTEPEDPACLDEEESALQLLTRIVRRCRAESGAPDGVMIVFGDPVDLSPAYH